MSYIGRSYLNFEATTNVHRGKTMLESYRKFHRTDPSIGIAIIVALVREPQAAWAPSAHLPHETPETPDDDEPAPPPRKPPVVDPEVPRKPPQPPAPENPPMNDPTVPEPEPPDTPEEQHPIREPSDPSDVPMVDPPRRD
jgi:hypothetical protein